MLKRFNNNYSSFKNLNALQFDVNFKEKIADLAVEPKKANEELIPPVLHRRQLRARAPKQNAAPVKRVNLLLIILFVRLLFI